MNPSTGQGITAFSPCSIGNICSALGRNSVKSNCLSSNKGIPLVTQAVCGNGIVEPGEECDSQGPCCNHATCKFASGSVCDPMSEECCTTSCQISSKDVVCRQSTGECDPAETCSGSSPTCPPDVQKQDGTKCGSQSGLACASGQCTSRNQQCKTLMGAYTSSNATSSSSPSSVPQACDDSNCVLSCSSPNFGNGGQCWGLNQNFLDGTPCGGGGKCTNGQCKGSSFGKEITGWISTHKPLVIGISVGIGSIILLMIIAGLFRRYRGGRRLPPKFNGSNPSFRQRSGPRGYQQTWSGSSNHTAAPGYVAPQYEPPPSGWTPAYGGGSNHLGRYA